MLTKSGKSLPPEDLGKKFGGWVVLSLDIYYDNKQRGYLYVKCPHKETFITLANLNRGPKGCRVCSIAAKNHVVYTNNEERRASTLYTNIMARCFNPKATCYAKYKDVEVHASWVTDRRAFIDYVLSLPGYDRTMTLDRIDNDKGYVPGNLRWADRKLQSENRKVTIFVEYNNEILSLASFSRKYTTLSCSYVRILYYQNWPLQKIAEHRIR